MPGKPVQQLDFSGGANYVVSPYLISNKQSADLQNLWLDEHGSARTRGGVDTLTTSPDTANPILYRGLFVKVDGTNLPFAIQGSSQAFVSGDCPDGITNFAAATSATVSSTPTGDAGGTVQIAAIWFQGSGQTVTSVTFDGVNLTFIGAATNAGNNRVELWGLNNPHAGLHNTVANFSGAATGTLYTHTLRNASGWDTPVTATGNSAAPTVAVPNSTNRRAVCAMIVNNVNAATAGGDIGGVGANQVTGASRIAFGDAANNNNPENMTWAVTAGQWSEIGVDLFAANQVWRTDTGPWTKIGYFRTAERLPDSVEVSGSQLIINGYETPWTWDGTAFSPITASGGQTLPPGAKHVAFHLGSVWIWNTNAATTSLDGPSSLRMADPNVVNSWPNANQTFVSKDDGQVGMGMTSFTIAETGIAPTATLLLFKNYSAYQVTGVFGGSTFSIQRIKSDMGCVSPRTIQFVAGFGVIRLTHKGFALYNGVEDRLISEEVRPQIFGGPSGSTVITGLDFSNIAYSWASQAPNPPLYVAACPTSGPGLTRIFVYDLIRRGWSICTIPSTLACLVLYLTQLAFPNLHGGTLTGGNILSMFDVGNFDDNGDDITWSMKTKAYFSQNQMEPAFWRRAQVSVLGQPHHQFTITPIVDGTARDDQVFIFPDSPTGASLVETVFAADIRETAHTVQLQISGVGRAYIRGVELQVSPKPVTKYISRA